MISKSPTITFLKKYLPYIICLSFILAYSTLGIIRHLHYGSFGYDLGINDQVVWRYSTLQAPISTIDPYPDKTKLYEHIEIVYALIAPFYWIWSNRRMLIVVQAVVACSGRLAMYLLGKQKKLKPGINLALMFSYLAFYGIQNALWFDVHSSAFAVVFLAWFF